MMIVVTFVAVLFCRCCWFLCCGCCCGCFCVVAAAEVERAALVASEGSATPLLEMRLYLQISKALFIPVLRRTRKVISSLPSYLGNLSMPSEVESGKQCTICRFEFAANEVVLHTPCLHLFHSNCVVGWHRQLQETLAASAVTLPCTSCGRLQSGQLKYWIMQKELMRKWFWSLRK